MKQRYWKGLSSFLALILFTFLSSPLVSFAETDVTEKVDIQQSRLRYDRRAQTSSLEAFLTNISSDSLLAPVKVVIDDISTPDVSVVNADGTTTDGKPFFEYAALDPGETSVVKRWVFSNPLRKRFTYELTVFDAAPAAITITGKAIAGIPVVGTINLKDSSDPVKTTFSAINADGSYTLNIDETWTPPFMMWAEGWVNNEHLRLLSTFDLDEGETQVNINTTPATTAVVASAMGVGASEIDPETAGIPDQGVVDQIRQTVEETLANLFDVIGIPPGFNLFETPIGEIGSPTDQLFDTVDFSTDDDDNIVVADAQDNDNQVVIDPDEDPVPVPNDIVDAIADTGDAFTQIRQILGDYYDLFDDPNNPPDRAVLDSELVPDLAEGFLQRGEGISDWIDRLELFGAPSDAASDFINCAIYRPMQTQYYGNTPVKEMPDSHDAGLWVLVTYSINGKVMTWPTSFVDIGNNTWKWYGNRSPFRRHERGRPRARLIHYPAGSDIYISGLSFWHNDVGNKAWDMGVKELAVFNPAFAPETIDGVDTHCVRLERRAGGIDTRYRLKQVPTWWDNDHIYQLSRETGDRLMDLDVLKSQEPIEFVVFGLDDSGNPIKTWMYTIPEAPVPVSELEADPDHYFARIDQDTISFQEYDPADEYNSFPGNGGLFSWTFPNNPDLFPSWATLGWEHVNWNWNEYEIDNPAWYGPGDFDAWASDIFQPGPAALPPHIAQFYISFRDTNKRHYQTLKRWDPWSEDMIRVENDSLIFDVSQSWSDQILNPDWGSLAARTRIRGTYLKLNRFEAPFVVESASADGNAYVETEIRLAYQPPEDIGNGDTNFVMVASRIRFQNGQLQLQGFVWGSRNAEGTDEISPAPSSGNFPYGMPLAFNQTYTLAVEYIAATNQLMVEFDNGSTGGPFQSFYDMGSIPNFDFDPDNFINAEIRSRVRSLQEIGDNGSIRVRIDSTKVDGNSYDEFTGGFGNNKWDIYTYE